mmetsp:Transcript_30363/g.78741  ORF Transcript_30363/g.78741 Transcript_30363/m.78741 type:complete len:180 (-) Transcript_30363:82-621(-)
MAKHQKTTTDMLLARWLVKHPLKCAKDLGFTFLRESELKELNASFEVSILFDSKQIGISIGRMYGRIMRLVGDIHMPEAADGAGNGQDSSTAAEDGARDRSVRSVRQAEAARAAEQAAATEHAERRNALSVQWQAFMDTVAIGHMAMLATFLDLPMLSGRYNPRYLNNGTLRESMRSAP